MDIRCPRCGEAWDLDTLHDVVAEQHEAEYRRYRSLHAAGRRDQANRLYDRLFGAVRADFRARGCQAIEGAAATWCQVSPQGGLVSALFDLAGDDLDGFASDLQDAEALGLFS